MEKKYPGAVTDENIRAIFENAGDDLIDKGVYQTMSANEKMRTLLGHVQLDIMIIDEAIKLQQVIKKGFISLVVAGRNKRDRIVACEYANYFFHLKELEMIKQQQQQNWNIDDFGMKPFLAKCQWLTVNFSTKVLFLQRI